MLDVAQWAQLLGTGLDIYGNLESGRGAASEGARRKVEAQFAKQQAEEDAIAVFASAQRDAFEENRKAELVQSRALAVAAASGGASDPSVVKMIAQIHGEGVYRAGVALYDGEAKARKLRIQGAAFALEGDNAVVSGLNRQQAYRVRALGSTAKGVASLYTRFGMNGPSGDSGLLD